MLVVPADVPRHFVTKTSKRERQDNTTQTLLLHAANEALDDTEATVLSDSAETGLHAIATAPLLKLASELGSMIGHGVLRWTPRSGHGSIQQLDDLRSGGKLRQDLESNESA